MNAWIIVIGLGGALLLGCESDSNDGGSGGASSSSGIGGGGSGGGTSTGGSSAGGSGGASGDCAAPGVTSCDADGLVLVCEDHDGTLIWSDPEPCESGSICKADACEPIGAAQLGQAAVVAAYTADLRDYTGYTGSLDFEALGAEAEKRVLLGDGSAYVFAKAMYGVFTAVPQGHASIGWGPPDWSACSDPDGATPLRGRSWYGVCARSAGDASIVSFAAPDNALGLAAGDRVVGITRGEEVWESPGFLARIAEEPLCDGSTASQSARDDYAASNLFAVLRAGDVLQVQKADGSMASVTAPARGAPMWCFDPFDRPEQSSLFTSFQRADGVVVVILPSFSNHPDHPFPNPFTFQTYRDWVAEAIQLVDADLAQYTGVTGLVWDIRGNGGGAQEYAMGLLGPLGASEGALGNCYARVPASDPPAFESEAEYPFPYQIFVDQPLPALSFTGKQAVLADGMAVSAADWMLHQAHRLGIPIIGHGAAGAYGYTVGGSYVDVGVAAEPGVHEGVNAYISGAACFDENEMPMEGNAPVDVWVDFDPADLAAGIDTQLEAAAAAVLQ
jgi:hypothetical protein